jgi:hypothetical protein
MKKNEFVIESGRVRPYLPFVIYLIMYVGSEYLAINLPNRDNELLRYVFPISIQLMLAWATWYIWKYQFPQLRIMERLSISGEDGFCITLKYVRNEVTLFGNAADIESVTCETFTVGNGSDTHVLLKIKDLGLVGFRSWRRSQAEKLCASISLPLSVINTESQTQSLRDKDLARISSLRSGAASPVQAQSR